MIPHAVPARAPLRSRSRSSSAGKMLKISTKKPEKSQPIGSPEGRKKSHKITEKARNSGKSLGVTPHGKTARSSRPSHARKSLLQPATAAENRKKVEPGRKRDQKRGSSRHTRATDIVAASSGLTTAKKKGENKKDATRRFRQHPTAARRCR